MIIPRIVPGSASAEFVTYHFTCNCNHIFASNTIRAIGPDKIYFLNLDKRALGALDSERLLVLGLIASILGLLT